MMGTLKKVRQRMTAPPINASRHHLMEFAREAAGRGSDKSFRVLDVGAGRGPYRDLFAHVSYETSDVKDFGNVDHVCSITNLSMADDTYDLVFCSQTLEHVSQPVRALREIRRVLKPGGEAWLSAPLFFEEHQQPVDFFRYTRFAWRRMARRAGFVVADISWLEGAYATSSYQMNMVARVLPSRMRLQRLLLLRLARRLALLDLEERVTNRGMCKNYRVRLVKPSPQAHG